MTSDSIFAKDGLSVSHVWGLNSSQCPLSHLFPLDAHDDNIPNRNVAELQHDRSDKLFG